ncbi:triose-phosphate isomerase [Agaribacter flavus]|uniref:Triosephosphate isomerase n=1 Tax=Agaribacter flavus TaxID=1902781 RepID=A0ABV7FK28_9ALTE
MQKNKRMMVAGNWKMNGNLTMLHQFKRSFPVFENIDVVLCLPSLYISETSSANFSIGAQDCSYYESGAHTGDISLTMLAEFDCKYVIVGHSERRARYNESNEIVAKKAKAVLENGSVPLVCVGEPLEVRDNGSVFDYVGEQLDAVIESCKGAMDNLVIAYEPVWAIGTGKTATPEQAQEVHAFIRERLSKYCDDSHSIRIVYGGSVSDKNAAELFAQPDIDGALVGGASLKMDSFSDICLAANERK